MGKHHHHPTIDYDAYQSGMSHWNTTFKVVFSLGILITVIAVNTLPVSIVTILYMLFLNVRVGKIKFGVYIRLMKIPLAFILMSAVAIMIEMGSGEDCLYRIRFFHTFLYITRENLLRSIGVSCKAFAAISGFFMMTLSTPMGEIISVLKRVHVPGIILELMHLIYRYIYILSEMNQRQRDAAVSRLGYWGWKTSLKTFGSEIANLFLMSMKKSEQYYDAMEARGYEGDCSFWEERKPFGRGQLSYAVCYAVLLLLIAFLISFEKKRRGL